MFSSLSSSSSILYPRPSAERLVFVLFLLPPGAAGVWPGLRMRREQCKDEGWAIDDKRGHAAAFVFPLLPPLLSLSRAAQ